MNEKQYYLDYYAYLLKQIENPLLDNYQNLIGLLWETDFFSLMKNDMNRACDGKILRRFYEQNTGKIVELGETSVLEMLIYLAIRGRDILYDGDATVMTISTFFWEIVSNLNFVDDYFVNSKKINQKTLERWLERQYERNGKGGLFPLKRPKKDQRKVEIWYQMNAYLMENYPIY